MKNLLFLLISVFVLTLGLTSCNYNRPLRRELMTIWNEDQDSRAEWNDIFKNMVKEARKLIVSSIWFDTWTAYI